ncbi:GDSL-type esterase/lipase family protein [Sinomonas sp. JGH33]|uniref:GDSL-type esterase/lipase family protein n=1 Tax=Sinomonas terricola TaxID=3110330 RepID=A0ABU5T0Y6_9MICC|nr:GDSL-type esterase/lipase family protein [Sinomonas sp. JGH33]MEA5453318.1 GDSL-type esterase/lipase family protein [Sinomonas sp. JGH33]
MTVQVSGKFTVQTQTGHVAAVGYLRWSPTVRVGSSSEVVLPASFDVVLDNTGSFSVNVDPTTSNWCWQVVEYMVGQPTTTHCFSLPGSGGPFTYGSLAEVDPKTLTAAAPTPAWVAMANSTVTSAAVDGSGNLILTRTDGTTVNAGQVATPSQPPIAGAKLAAIGDSITATNDYEAGFNGQTNNLYQDSWLDYACLMSGGSLRRGINAGIAGQTSVQMAARFQNDVLSTKPSVAVILCGTNDVGQSVSAGGSTPDATTIAGFQGSIQSMVQLANAAHVRVILSTIPPNNASNRHYLITQLNLWLKLYASTNGLTLLDFYGQAADPTTGNYLISWGSGDGTHPGTAGQQMFGQYVANKLSPLMPANSPFVAQDDADPVSILTHPLFLGGALNGQGIPPGWQIASGFPSGLAVSYVTDSAVGGNMWQVQSAATASPYYVQFPLPSAKWSVGDRLAVGGIITTNGGNTATVAFQNQSGALAKLTPAKALTRGYFYMEQVVPSGSTSMYLNINTPTGTGISAFGQLGVYNLTRLGLTS